MAVYRATDADQVGGVLAQSNRVGGRLRSVVGTHELTTAMFDNVDDVILLTPRLPSHACIHEFSVGHDDLEAGGAPTLAFDYGLTDLNGADIMVGTSGGAGGDGDSRHFFANNVTATGAVALTNRRFAGVTPDNMANLAQMLWQLMAYTVDPVTHWFPCVRVHAVAQTPAAGTIFWRILCTVD